VHGWAKKSDKLDILLFGNNANIKMRRIIEILLFVTIIIVLGYAIFKMYNEPYFWYDEAVQFYDALGIDYNNSQVFHDLGNVHYKNSRFNMDPGGYTLLLHFWTKISINPFFIRLLNWLFFFMLLSFVWAITQQHLKDRIKNLSVVLFLLVFNNAMVIDRAIEVRGYMIELMVVVATIYFLINGRKLINSDKYNLKYIGILAILCFGMWSRYSTVVSLGLGWFLFSVSNLGLFSKKAVLGHMVILVNVFLIYHLMLKWQNPFGLPMDYLDYLNTKSGWKALLNSNLYYFAMLAIVIVIQLQEFNWDKTKRLKLFDSENSEMDSFNIAIVFVVLLNVAFFSLSVFGRHPYEPLAERNFGVTFSTVLVAMLFLLNRFKVNVKLFGFSAAILILYSFENRSNFHRGVVNYYFSEEINFIDSLLDKNPKSKLSIAYWPGLEIKCYSDIVERSIENKGQIEFQQQPILVHKETAEYFGIQEKFNSKPMKFEKGSFHLVHKYGDTLYNAKIRQSKKTLIREFKENKKLYRLL
jgi:hypothetical protein